MAAFELIESPTDLVHVVHVELDDELDYRTLPRRCIPLPEDVRQQRARVPS
jgi:hypothetical protein